MAESVVVALPPVGDRVTKISSEDEAHLTILFLGEVDLSAEAILYVQHACRELSPFGLTVDHRGTLGEDDADVLFFDKNSWDLERVAEFRHHLLLNDEIKRAYDTAPQYPEWTPHLTLGYPERPAKELDEDGRLGYVNFDRIAVWTGDSEGPEFRLKYDDTAMEVAMSDLSLIERGSLAAATILGHDTNAVEHYGVKGMKWGVRNDKSAPKKPRGAIRRGLTKVGDSLDAANKVTREGSLKTIGLPEEKRQEVLADVQTYMIGAAIGARKNPKYAGKDIKRDPALRAEYKKDMEKVASDYFSQRLIEEYTTLGIDLAVKATSTYYDHRSSKLEIRGDIKDTAKHAEEDPLAVFDLEHDDSGFITDVSISSDSLQHYGVKGMKWGVRNDKGHEGERVKTKKLAKLDKKWEKENTGVHGWVKVNNAVADRMNNGLIDKHNNDPRWADVDDFYNEKDPRVQEYFSEFEKLSNRIWAEETVKLGSNPSGTKAYELREDEDGNPYGYLAPKKDSVRHAEDDAQSVLKIHRDVDGRVETVETVEVELRHYGVKGMKWGVRKDRSGGSSGPTPVTITQKKPNTYAKTSGGKGHGVSEDAAKALSARQKAKGSTTDALSNAELRMAIDRMQLEQRFNELSYFNDRRSSGSKFVAGLIGQKRYGGKEKMRYKDSMEEAGTQTRKAADQISKLLEEKVSSS